MFGQGYASRPDFNGRNSNKLQLIHLNLPFLKWFDFTPLQSRLESPLGEKLC